jgi:hypothetical protein
MAQLFNFGVRPNQYPLKRNGQGPFQKEREKISNQSLVGIKHGFFRAAAKHVYHHTIPHPPKVPIICVFKLLFRACVAIGNNGTLFLRRYFQ